MDIVMPVGIFVVVAALWLSLVAYAQYQCPLPSCNGGGTIGWYLPLFTSPIGGFAVPGLILMAIVRIFRR
jgi:hypothetical protein